MKRPIKWYAKLLTSKGRKKEGYFLIEGIRQVSQVLQNNRAKVDELLVLEGVGEDFDYNNCRYLTEKQMATITDSVTVPKVVAVVKMEHHDISDTRYSDNILFLEDVQDPGNIGTLIRSAIAFGFNSIMLTSGCADPFSPKVVRSTGGAILEIKIFKLKNYLEDIKILKTKGFLLLVADIGGGISSVSLDKKTILALGNEGNGISDTLREMADEIYTIPYENKKIESLNVAIAGSIIMSHLYK